MKKLNNIDLVEEYFNSVRDKYPGLTFEECKEIVTTPFEMLKGEMAEGNLSTVRLKYFGTFLVYKARAKGMLKHLTDRFKLHKIDRNEYFETKKIIEDFVEEDD